MSNETFDQRVRMIPAAIRDASRRNPHLSAGLSYYVVRGELSAWARCFDVLSADVARLTEECERRGYTPPTLPIGPWPEGDPNDGSALTREQETALLHAADVYALRIAGAVRAAMCDLPTPIFVRVD